MVAPEQIADGLKRLRGVRAVYPLTEGEKARILKAEEEAGQRVLLGLGRSDNRGVKEALARETSLTLITDAEFEWPKGPQVLLMWEREILGGEFENPDEIERFKQRKGVVVSGCFVIFKDKMPPARQLASNPPTVVFPPKPLPQLERRFGVRDAVIGFPCPPTDRLLKEAFNISVENHSLGTAIVGFNQ